MTITVTDVTFGCATARRGRRCVEHRPGKSDCEALLEARNKLEDGGARLNWWQGTPVAGWEGITLRGTPSRVAWVDLRAKGLSGTVPAELGQLSMLTYLNLHSNRLTGTIPAELARLSRLETSTAVSPQQPIDRNDSGPEPPTEPEDAVALGQGHGPDRRRAYVAEHDERPGGS